LLELNHHFDLAILDMQMPEMNGLELARAIRKIPGYQDLPLVVLSSIGISKEEADRAMVNFAAILSKPIKQLQLHDALAKVLGGRGDLVAQARTEQEQEVANNITNPTHSLRILLAEDNLVNQKVALHMLKRIGYEADVVMNGQEALDVLHRSVYDVVLMDLQMPKMDGLEATRRIIADLPAARRPQIVAMTANAMEGDRELCIATGMNDYITKPVKIEQLARVLSQCQPLATKQFAEQATFN
jgi:CheY-like chemotaxis protein